MRVAILSGFAAAFLAASAMAATETNVVQWSVVNRQASLEPLVKESLRFLTAVTKGDFSDAQRVFSMKDSLRSDLQQGHDMDIFGSLNLRPPYTIKLVGVDTITEDDVILIYILNTEDGPVAFKMDTYEYDGTEYMAHMTMTSDWDEIETMLNAAYRLSEPLEIQVNPQDPDGDPQIVPQK